MSQIDIYEKNMYQGGIDIASQEKLIKSRVLVMGAGGLGSTVIMTLAALGVGQIKIVDSGIIDISDFNRQIIHKYKSISRAKVMSAKDWVCEYNPDIKVEIDKTVLNDSNYTNIVEGYDIIIDCFNSKNTKYLLNEIAIKHNKILIHACAEGFIGKLTTIVPGETGCLECIIPKKEFEDDYMPKAHLSPVINTVASLQANEALKIITGEGETLKNKLLTFNGLTNEFRITNYIRNYSCPICGIL